MKKYLLGVDLGKRQDYSAALTVQRKLQEQERDGIPESWAHQHEAIVASAIYHVVDIRRWDIGTDYLEVVDDLRSALQFPKLLHRTALIVDATGVGAPVIELMERMKMEPTGVLMTGGTTSSIDEEGLYHVSKHSLITKLQLVFQSGRVKINPDLKLAETLKEELKRFTTKITRSGNDAYEAFSEKDHDDMVIALAIVIWHAENEMGSEVVVGRQAKREDYDPLRIGQTRDPLRN